MSRLFEELDRRPTPMGEISVRRRLEPTLQIDVYEVILGEEHLMSSLFTVAEIAPGRPRPPAGGGRRPRRRRRGPRPRLHGPSGAGRPRVRSLEVVEALPEVIEWTEQDVLPLSSPLVDDERCRLVLGDFFALDIGVVDAILLDVDHTPRHVLHPSHAAFYTPEGTRRLAGHLHPGGVFGLWSDDPPDDDYVAVLSTVFTTVDAQVVPFPNHHTGGTASNTIYLASGATPA